MRRVRRPLLALVALVAALAVGYAVQATRSDDPAPRPTTTTSTTASATASTTARTTAVPHGATDAVPLSQLPVQARQTLDLIRRGGPYPYPTHDGSVFRNSEHRLPVEPAGFYREYTVPTPGSEDRGARRIIAGRDGTYWYTADHYDTFRRIDVSG